MMTGNSVWQSAPGIDRSVAIVDDDAELRESTASVLEMAGYCVREYASGEEFLSSRMDVAGVVLDLDMPGKTGIEVLQAMADGGGGPPVVMLSGRARISHAIAAMKSGAADVLEKPCPPAALIEAIERAFRDDDGRRAVRDSVSRAAKMVLGLSARQRQILSGIVAGKLNKIIAHDLGLSVRTVEAHRAALCDRLGIRGTAEAVRIGVASGLFDNRHRGAQPAPEAQMIG